MIEILIIGAGPSGLCAAKTFLQHDNEANILIVDAGSTVGGIWATDRLYPTLKTNNVFSTVDFSDFPMDAKRFDMRPGEHIPGETMHAYYHAYAAHFQLLDKIRLNTRVREIRRREADGDENNKYGGWEVEVDDGEVLRCKKLVVATGVQTNPHKPRIEGAGDFRGPFIHSASLGNESENLINNPDIRTITVIGGSKSAYDAVYLAASTGHEAEWIIRRSGRGPVWVIPPYTMMGPFRALRERLITRRIVSLMSPWSFPDYSGFGWLRRFLHFSRLGQAIAQKFWGKLHASGLRDCRFREDEKFADLEPEQNPFWYGTSSGVLNYPHDILSYVASGRVRVHRADISHLSDHAIHLRESISFSPSSKSGSISSPSSASVSTPGTTAYPVDAIIACTGYSAKPILNFSPPSLHSDLGIPSTSLSPSQSEFWSQLDSESDLTIGRSFPRLLLGPYRSPSSTTPHPFHPGSSSPAESPYTPWRLYRGIAPPGLTAADDHSLVFISMSSGIANTIRTEIQCLWALAYFMRKLPGLERDKAKKRVFPETALFQRFVKHRAPYGHGSMFPDLVADQVPYWDLLVHDLGLETRRKRGGWRELVEPYTQRDYAGLVEEWLKENR